MSTQLEIQMAELSLNFIGYLFARLPRKEYLPSWPEADVRGKKEASWPEWNGRNHEVSK